MVYMHLHFYSTNSLVNKTEGVLKQYHLQTAQFLRGLMPFPMLKYVTNRRKLYTVWTAETVLIEGLSLSVQWIVSNILTLWPIANRNKTKQRKLYFPSEYEFVCQQEIVLLCP